MPQESASIGLPGDIENIVRLAADHSNMCRFDTTDQHDLDIYKHVQGNLRRLYQKAVSRQALALQNSSSPAAGAPSLANAAGSGLY